MANSNKLMKLCALASSLLLAIGFISFQAGAFKAENESANEAVEPIGSAPNPVAGSVEIEPVPIHIMPGSKTARVFVPEEKAESNPDDAAISKATSSNSALSDEIRMSGAEYLPLPKIFASPKELTESLQEGELRQSSSKQTVEGVQ